MASGFLSENRSHIYAVNRSVGCHELLRALSIVVVVVFNFIFYVSLQVLLQMKMQQPLLLLQSRQHLVEQETEKGEFIFFSIFVIQIY